MTQQPQIIYKKRSFWSQAALGFSLFMITLTISGTLVLLFGMYIVNDKTDNMLGLVQSAVKSLPDVQKSLPPVLADVLSDKRHPEYRKSIEIKVKPVDAQSKGDGPVYVEVTNNGECLVSLLTLRMTFLDASDNYLFSRHVWAATPFAADEDWPGPLMPGTCRYLSAGSRGRGTQAADVKVEITDLRVWDTGSVPPPEAGRVAEPGASPAIQRAKL